MLLELATLPTTTTLAEKQGDQSKSPHLSPADLQYRYLLPTGTTYLLHRRLGSTVNVHLHSRIFFCPSVDPEKRRLQKSRQTCNQSINPTREPHATVIICVFVPALDCTQTVLTTV